MKKTVGQIAYVLLILAMMGLGLWLLSLISDTVLYIILAVLILLVMVTIHEFGHYIAGKALKFKINEFAIGFGPKLFSFKRKNGEIFSIRLFPLGGFCAFEGENETEEIVSEKPDSQKKEEIVPFTEYSNEKNITINNLDSQKKDEEIHFEIKSTKSTGNVIDSDLKRFTDQHPWKRIVVLFAGGAFNLLSAIFFSFLFILIVGFEQPKIDLVYAHLDDPTAYYSQLKEDDTLIAINGKNIGILSTYSELLSNVKLNEEVTVTVLREGLEMDLIIVKQNITIINDEGKQEDYTGFGFKAKSNFVKVDFGYAIKYSVPFTGKLAWIILRAFGGLFTGNVAVTELSGPVGTIGAIAERSQDNWRNIFLLLPLIAANLGLFNLFPIPALDGSKIVFGIIEWIRKKPVSRNVETYIHLIGMVLLLLFVIIIDIISFV